MSDCLFCRIVAGAIPSQKVFEGEDLIAVRDINPQAPVHVLLLPKKHIASVLDAKESDSELLDGSRWWRERSHGRRASPSAGSGS